LTKFRGRGGKKSERNRARKSGKTSQELVCKQTAPEVVDDMWALLVRKKMKIRMMPGWSRMELWLAWCWAAKLYARTRE
jgi:hypothetical protein